MTGLPYLRPEKDIHLNVGIVILIIKSLSLTKRKKLVLTIDKLQSFYYLVTRPVLLNMVLDAAGKPFVPVAADEYYTVSALSIDFDELFDKDKIKKLLTIISSRNLIEFDYSGRDGFLVYLSEEGEGVAESLSGDYFDRVGIYIDHLKLIQSESSSKINNYINHVFRQEMK